MAGIKYIHTQRRQSMRERKGSTGLSRVLNGCERKRSKKSFFKQPLNVGCGPLPYNL